ncbi:uncharacterized protein LOC132273834 [Cornus florida]|uniref:uncharacterized protein LOC132273834 n=1 Tax=Cornus florida TaxID=4283 RepID=UPI002897AA4A|nr:uncharacterized protein LOC132273834 [Cornus florida]
MVERKASKRLEQRRGNGRNNIWEMGQNKAEKWAGATLGGIQETTGLTMLKYYIENRNAECVVIEDEDIADELSYWANSVIRLPSEEDLISVMSRFHTFQGRAVIVKKWHKCFQLERDILETVPIWMKVYDLPVHARSGTSISKIISNIAKPLYMDGINLNRERGMFVRVLAEMEVKGGFPEFVHTKLHGCQCRAQIEYEWKPQLCKLCQKIDHNEKMCPLNIDLKGKQKVSEQWVVKRKVDSIAMEEDGGSSEMEKSIDKVEERGEDEGFIQSKSKTRMKIIEGIQLNVVSYNAFEVLDVSTERVARKKVADRIHEGLETEPCDMGSADTKVEESQGSEAIGMLKEKIDDVQLGIEADSGTASSTSFSNGSGSQKQKKKNKRRKMNLILP